MSEPEIQQQPTIFTAAADWWRSLPFFTKSCFVLLTLLYVIQLFFGIPEYSDVCVRFYSVLFEFQIWRPFSHVLFHANFFHILFNLLTLISLGTVLEKTLQMGTFNLMMVSLFMVFGSGLLYIFIISLFMYFPILSSIPPLFGSSKDLLGYTCGVGFSGILFSWMVLSSYFTPDSSQISFFGSRMHPAIKFLYPWIILILCSILVPNASFLGHLSGLLCGYLFVFGILEPPIESQKKLKLREKWFKIVEFLENRLIPSGIKQFPSYMYCCSYNSEANQQSQQNIPANNGLEHETVANTTNTDKKMPEIGGHRLGTLAEHKKQQKQEDDSLANTHEAVLSSLGSKMKEMFSSVKGFVFSSIGDRTRLNLRTDHVPLDEEEEPDNYDNQNSEKKKQGERVFDISNEAIEMEDQKKDEKKEGENK